MTPRPILLVDDDLEGIQVAHDLLVREGFAVLTSQTATTALNLLREATPALVMTAAVLPDAEPLELVRTLRGDPAAAGLPVVVVGREDDIGAVRDALDAGADAFLQKPLRPSDLYGSVCGLLSFADARDRARQEGALHRALGDVVSRLARHEPWEVVLPDVARAVARAIPDATAMLVVRMPLGERAMIAALATADEQSAPEREVELARFAEMHETLRHGRSVMRADLPYDLLGAALGREEEGEESRRNVATFPIRHGRQGQGLLLLALPYPPRELSVEQRTFAARVAEACSPRVADVRRVVARERVDAARKSWLDSDVVLPSWSERDDSSERHKLLVNLVEHSADAIVAADMGGTVRVFNRSAEKLFGYSSEGVVGRLHVANLSLPGTAEEHMRIMRSGKLGEPGFVHDLQTEILSADGEIVPVNLSAAILHEGEEEVATVGIFHDLRRRLALETRIEEMSAQLVEKGKQATLAALAGTTAHELNQPLTAIMGLVEMLQLQAEGRVADQLERVYHETERMSAIVQRIGRITRFSTKSYVRDTEILDLDEASEVK